MDLNDILLFTKLVESKTLTSAAELLGIPKSTVSRRLSQLESTLGVKLFERNTRHFTLTDVGMAYYVRCTEIVASITAANQYVTDLQVAPRGRIRLTVPTDVASRYFGRMLAAFTRAHPEINIELVVSDRVHNLVEDGFDLALRTMSATSVTASKLVSVPLWQITGMLCASPEYLANHGLPEKIEDLYAHQLLVFMPEGIHTFTLTDGTSTYEIAPPARLLSDYYAPIRDALVGGAGIGVLADYAIARELASGELVRVLPAWFTAPAELAIVYPARQTMPPRLSLLVDHLTREFASPPWQAELAKASSAQAAAVEQVQGRRKSTGIARPEVDVEDRGHGRAVTR